jgi:hypothetical protein
VRLASGQGLPKRCIIDHHFRQHLRLRGLLTALAFNLLQPASGRKRTWRP